jgi:hypothetical protein
MRVAVMAQSAVIVPSTKENDDDDDDDGMAAVCFSLAERAFR